MDDGGGGGVHCTALQSMGFVYVFRLGPTWELAGYVYDLCAGVVTGLHR